MIVKSSPSSEPSCALGIDVGGTKIAAGLVTFPEGRIELRREIPTPRRGGNVETLSALVSGLMTDGARLNLDPRMIGLGVCELVDRNGVIKSAHSLDWRSLPIQEELSRFAPVTIEADVRAAALAESLFGGGREFAIFLYVTVGTGISSCLMMNGQPYRGARGATGTMASSPFHFTCQSCGLINATSVEDISAGPAVASRYRELSGVATGDARDVLKGAATGDEDAWAVVENAAETLASAVGMLVNVLDPEAVVLGGGLGSSDGAYWQAFQGGVRKYIWSDLNRNLPVIQATTGPDAGLLGAAAMAWQRSDLESS